MTEYYVTERQLLQYLPVMIADVPFFCDFGSETHCNACSGKIFGCVVIGVIFTPEVQRDSVIVILWL